MYLSATPASTHLEVATFVKCVRGSKDGHFPIIQVRLLHQSDAKAFHWLLLEGFQLQHEGLLGAGHLLLCHVDDVATQGQGG